ncbi:DDE superfamily endonuclease domain-containing protein [Phthorimaea operculella]|nr:DDE superfamily endonuclease domain-containing protein [Phthorimaea operculella]
MDDLCALLKSGAQRSYDIENIIKYNSTLCKYWLGYTYEQFQQLLIEIPAISERVKSPKTSLAMFLMKLRTGETNDRIASLFHVASGTVFNHLNIVRECFKDQFIQLHLGRNTLSIQQVAQYNLMIPNGLFGDPDADPEFMPAIAIGDGTYVYIQKSSNYLYQKQTYSLHKFRNLVKPFLLVCCNGYIIDVFGPYPAIESDSSIMLRLFHDGSPLRSYFRPNDVFILDRGFRDAIPVLQQLGYKAYIPETKEPEEHQLSTLAANKSRCVTLCRWVVEVVNGRFKRDFKLFRQNYFNRASSHLMLDFRIAAALTNRFHVKIRDNIHAAAILAQAQAKLNTTNNLAPYIETHHLNRVRAQFTRIDGNLPELDNFPRLTFNDLILFALGIYQIKQARSYYGEHVRAAGGVYSIEVFREPVGEFGPNNYLLRGKIESRHTTRKTYFSYILVDSNPSVVNTRAALVEYCCNCLVGRRTVGCCAHVMSIVWFYHGHDTKTA